MQGILQHSTRTCSQFLRLTTQQLEAELRKLESEAQVQREELDDLVAADNARPYRPEFMATMRSGYGSSLRDLHSQIANVRRMLEA